MSEPIKAALYARVSTEEQADEGKESLKSQLDDMRSYCERRDYEPLEPYVDVQSGADLRKQRPAFQRMLTDIQAGAVGVVVVWRHDRAFRDLKPMVELRDALDAANIDIEGVTMPLDRRTLGVMAWVAEQELDNLRERVRMGKRGMARKGLYPCGIPPYGYAYDAESKQLVLDEGEKRVVRRIYSMYLTEGLAIRAIARKLNADKIPTRQQYTRSRDGKPKGWLAAQVARILASPTYKGQFRYARRKTGRDGRRRTADPDNIIEVPVPAIVSEGTWEQARQKAERNKHHGQGHENMFYLLRGLLYCDECGRPFRAFGQPAGKQVVDRRGNKYIRHKEYRAYGCRGQGDHPHIYNCRSPQFVRAERLEDPVWEVVASALRDPETLREAAAVRLEGIQENERGGADLIAKRKRQLAKAAKERDGAVSMAARGVIGEDDLRTRLEQLDADTVMWREELERLTKASNWKAEAEKVKRLLEAFCSDIGPTLEELTLQERRELLIQVVEKIRLAGDGTIRIEGVLPFSEGQLLTYQETRSNTSRAAGSFFSAIARSW